MAIRCIHTNSTANTGYVPPIAGYVGLWDVSVASTLHSPGGGLISQWDDRSGNGYNLVQAVGSQQPILVGSGISAYLNFDRAAGFQSLHASMTYSQPITVFLVSAQFAWGVGLAIFDLNGGALGVYTHGTPNNVSLYNNGFGSDNSQWTVGSQMVLCGVFNSSSSTLSVNDGTKTTTGTSGTLGMVNFYLADWKNAGASTSQQVKLALIYPSALSAANQTTIINSLKTYCGI